MTEVLGEHVFRTADGACHRVRITQNHPESGRRVPGVRFLSFEDLEGRPLGVAGVNPKAATLELNSRQLERLLEMAGKCQAIRSR